VSLNSSSRFAIDEILVRADRRGYDSRDPENAENPDELRRVVVREEAGENSLDVHFVNPGEDGTSSSALAQHRHERYLH